MRTTTRLPWWVRLLGALLAPWLRRVPFAAEAVDQVRELAREGKVVYLLRSADWLDALLLIAVARRHHLPVPTIFFGLGRPTEEPVASVPSGALVFLKETAGESCDPVRAAVHEVRRDAGTRIFLLPVALLWNLKPRSMERSLLEILLGPRENAGWLRKLYWLLAAGRQIRVLVAEPVALHEFAREREEEPEQVTTRKVRLSVRYHLAQAERAVLGPRLVPRKRIIERVLKDPELQAELRRLAEEQRTSRSELELRVRKNLDEIAADYNWTMIRLLEFVLTKIWSRIYEDFQVDLDGLERVREAMRSGPVILLPCHKSHMDYLILSYLFKINDLPPPHIAAGVNLSFFPMGPIFRKSGAFFIRRSFVGDRLYELSLATYIKVLLLEHYNIEFFIEGTRSRSGKIMPPKFGLLGMIVRAQRRMRDGTCHLVPIAIDYESLVEEASIVREAAGAEKTPENLGSLIKARSTLSKKYGSVYVRFGDPLPLPALLDEVAETTGDEREQVKRIAYKVIDRIQGAVTVTSTALVATALCVHHKRGIRHDVLLARIALIRDAVVDHGASLASDFLYGTLEPERALDLLLRNKIVRMIEIQGERVYTVADDARLALDYYKNNIVHFLVDTSFACLAFRVSHDDDFEHLWQGFRDLHTIFIEEFHRVYRPPQPEELRRELDWLAARGFVTLEGGRWRVIEPEPILAFENVTRNFVESAYIAVMTLLEARPREEARDLKEWLKMAMDMGELLYAKGDVWRSESRSKVNLQNALNSFRHQGILEPAPEVGRRRRALWRIEPGHVDRLEWMRRTLGQILLETQLN